MYLEGRGDRGCNLINIPLVSLMKTSKTSFGVAFNDCNVNDGGEKQSREWLVSLSVGSELSNSYFLFIVGK